MAQLTVPIAFDHNDLQRMVDEKIAEVKAQFIPKDQYEARLKADMVAMLTELQLEFEENTVRWYVGRVDGKSDDVVLMETINDIIQQKINVLQNHEINQLFNAKNMRRTNVNTNN